MVQRIEQLRRQRLTGWHIAQATGCSRATVSRVLRRLGLNCWRDLQPAPPIVRYEHLAPGDLLHLDIKQLGRFSRDKVRPDGRRRGAHHSGWEYLHVAIDDHSRIAFSQVLPNFTAAAAIAFLRSAVAYYASLGIPIRALLTDNGHCYRSHAFHHACIQLDLRHRFTRPYTPRTNGKAERFIQTALREWVYARAYQDSSQRNHQMHPWLHHYNWHRPHGSLNHAPPIRRSGLAPDNLLRLHCSNAVSLGPFGLLPLNFCIEISGMGLFSLYKNRKKLKILINKPATRVKMLPKKYVHRCPGALQGEG